MPAPTSTELPRLVEHIGYRVGRHLERRGLLVRDAERAYLEWECEQASTLDDLVSRQFVRFDSIASIEWARDTAGMSFVILIHKG